MTAKIIKNNTVELTSGENSVLRKLKNMYAGDKGNVFIYVQPCISNCRPDFVVIDAKRGLTILEVKDWSSSYIHEFTNGKVVLNDREERNPIKQLKNYYSIIKGLTDYGFVNMDIMDGDISEIVHGKLIFTNLSSDDIDKNNYRVYLKNSGLSYIPADKYKKLEIDDLFDNAKIELTEKIIDSLRVILFPEIKVADSCNLTEDEFDVKALDEEQEEFARRIPYGNYMVSGVPGCGKTVILRARAIQLAKEHPDWNIIVLSYNKALVRKLDEYFTDFKEEVIKNPYQNIDLSNIQVKTFHQFAMNVANVTRVPRNADDTWWRTTIVELADSQAVPVYDAILIDEYQDFYDNWIKLCVKCCKKYKVKNSLGEEIEMVNMFLAGDRLQSLYNPTEISWNSLGINMRGRSKLLKTSYRTTKEAIISALKLLEENNKLKSEVEKFYKDENDNQVEINNINEGMIDYLEGGYQCVADKIEDIIENCHYQYDDILVLCKTHRICENIKDKLHNRYQYVSHIIYNNQPIPKNKILFSTYHSSKGLEAKAIILVDADSFTLCDTESKEIKQRKLFYVGMTRSSERLYIHAQNFRRPSYANEVRYKLDK